MEIKGSILIFLERLDNIPDPSHTSDNPHLGPKLTKTWENWTHEASGKMCLKNIFSLHLSTVKDIRED